MGAKPAKEILSATPLIEKCLRVKRYTCTPGIELKGIITALRGFVLHLDVSANSSVVASAFKYCSTKYSRLGQDLPNR